MTDPRYGTKRWRRLADSVIRRDGRVCALPGCTTDMTLPGMVCVDHIIDKSDGGPFWDPANLQVLCRPHNMAKGLEASAGRSKEPRSPNG